MNLLTAVGPASAPALSEFAVGTENMKRGPEEPREIDRDHKKKEPSKADAPKKLTEAEGRGEVAVQARPPVSRSPSVGGRKPDTSSSTPAMGSGYEVRQRRTLGGQTRGTTHGKQAAMHSDAPATKSRVDVAGVGISAERRQVESLKVTQLKYFGWASLVTTILLLSWYAGHRLLCPPTFFCDYEVGGPSSIHALCVPCPDYGFCAEGELLNCEPPFQKRHESCVREGELESEPGVVRQLMLMVLCSWTLPLLGTVFVMWYWYWHIVAQAENLLVEALSNEVKGYVMRMEYSGQVWHLEQLGAEVAAKYPDLQFLWPQVTTEVLRDARFGSFSEEGEVFLEFKEELFAQ